MKLCKPSLSAVWISSYSGRQLIVSVSVLRSWRSSLRSSSAQRMRLARQCGECSTMSSSSWAAVLASASLISGLCQVPRVLHRRSGQQLFDAGSQRHGVLPGTAAAG